MTERFIIKFSSNERFLSPCGRTTFGHWLSHKIGIHQLSECLMNFGNLDVEKFEKQIEMTGKVTNKNQPCHVCGEVNFNYQMYSEFYCNNPAHSPRRVKKIYPGADLLKSMITDYKNHGERVDEVLYQEVMEVIKENQIKSIICREYDLLQIENNRLREKCATAYKEIYDLKINASIKGLFDGIELTNDAEELTTKILKSNWENMRLREAIKQALEKHKWNNEESARVLEKALEGVSNDQSLET